MTLIFSRVLKGFRTFTDGLTTAETLLAIESGCRLRVRLFYCCLLFIAADSCVRWQEFVELGKARPLWPVWWVTGVDWVTAVNVIFGAFLIGSLAAVIVPGKLWARAAALIGCLEFLGLANSFGKIGHRLHVWAVIACLFVFLPRNLRKERPDPSRAQSYCVLFWGAQAFTLLTYSMAGLTKLLGAGVQLWRGETTIFSPLALSAQVAERLLQTNEVTMLGPFLIDHPWLGYVLFFGVLFLEVCAFGVAFRPVLHAPWAIAVMCIHIGIFLAMGIQYTYSILLLAVLFVPTPFQSADVVLPWDSRGGRLAAQGTSHPKRREARDTAPRG